MIDSFSSDVRSVVEGKLFGSENDGASAAGRRARINRMEKDDDSICWINAFIRLIDFQQRSGTYYDVD